MRNSGLAFVAASFAISSSAMAADAAAGAKGACAWPKSVDAIVAAPGNHRVLLENDQVRVLDVVVAPHTKEPVHAHCAPSVLHFLEAGDFVDYDANGKVLFDTRTLKTPLSFPLTMWKGPEAPHTVENLSDKPIHLIRVELKSQAQ